MEWDKKTDEQLNAYATIVDGGESDIEVSLTEDDVSLIWYLLVNALLEKGEAVHFPNSSHKEWADPYDFEIDHIPVSQINELYEKIHKIR